MFIEFSTAFSLDFGKRRKTELPDGMTLEEIEIEADTETADDQPETLMGFRPNEELD